VFRINILDGTKTSTSGRRYDLEDGPGCMGNPRVDRVLALAMYPMVRGDADGFLICPFNALPFVGWEMSVHIKATDNTFVEPLRHSLDEAGAGSYKLLGTHSCKRGGVQLYRLLGVADAEIKERGGWHTMAAYWAYVEASNRLEKRFTYTSPAASLADVIVDGGAAGRDQQLVVRHRGMSATIVQRGRFLLSNLLLQVVKRPAALTLGRASLADRLSAATGAKWRIVRTLRIAIKARSLQRNTIVYVPSRAQAETVCKQLVLAAKDQKLVAAGAALNIRPYVAGRKDRCEVEQLFLSQLGVVVVARIAFGLGVDCARVSVIIHFVRCWNFAHLFW